MDKFKLRNSVNTIVCNYFVPMLEIAESLYSLSHLPKIEQRACLHLSLSSNVQ